MKTEEFQELYSHRHKIDVKNAEIKNNYNYGNAQSCGKIGMMIQGVTTLFLVNMENNEEMMK